MTSQHPSLDRIVDYVHHELSPSEDAELFEHISQCTPCRAEYEAELQLTAALRTAAAEQTLEMPTAIVALVRQRVRSTPAAGWRTWFRPLIALPVGAAIAVAAFFAVQTTMPATRPAVGAQYYFDLHSAAARQENPLTDRSAPVFNVIEASDVSSNPPLPLVEAAHAVTLGDDPDH
jgi:anti-sigma factor RsiW